MKQFNQHTLELETRLTALEKIVTQLQAELAALKPDAPVPLPSGFVYVTEENKKLLMAEYGLDEKHFRTVNIEQPAPDVTPAYTSNPLVCHCEDFIGDGWECERCGGGRF